MKKIGMKLLAVMLSLGLCAGIFPVISFASSKTERAEERVDEAKEAVIAAQDALAEAQDALDAAAEKYDAGAFAFFEDVGATSALNVLNTAKYSSYTEKGSGKDATSFSNMLASIDFIRECNDLRKSEGCSELKVSYYMMAIAMSDTNASAYTMGHTQQYSVGENLAWGYKDPFEGWYTEEKAEYEAGDTNFSSTGHYQNIVNNSYTITGFAMNQYGSYGVTHGQVFQYSSDGAMSVDAYEKELTAYIASLDQDVLTEKVFEAEAALDDAEEEQREAEEALAKLLADSEDSDVTPETEENGTDTEEDLTDAEEEPAGTAEDAMDPDQDAVVTEENETESESEDPNYGFSVSQLSLTYTFKVDHAYSTHGDGSNTFRIFFFTDGDEEWIDKNVTFKVEDVTSAGVLQVMSSAGISYVEPKVTIDTADGELAEAVRYHYVRYVTLPIGEDGPVLGSGIKATSGKEITVEAGQSTRCVKITAYKDGEVIDTVYTRTSKATDGGYSAADKRLYECACASIEAQIWSKGMTNLEKLTAFADYISSVSHYPNSATTDAAYNPEWAALWGEDGITDYKLIWWNFADQYVDWTMALQGGQSTCLAANMLYDIALNDLGLKAITIDDTDAGEGVCVGIGKNSSNPTNGSHYSLVYQAADGTRTFVDAQGMDYGSGSAKVTCSEHGCRSKVIPISGYSTVTLGNEADSDPEDTDTVIPTGEDEENDAGDSVVVVPLDENLTDEGESAGDSETVVQPSDDTAEENADGTELSTEETSDETEDAIRDGKEGEDTTAAPEGILIRLLNGDDTDTTAASDGTSGTPKTGDTNSWMWYLMLAAGGAGLAGAAVVVRKKQRKA